MYYVVLTPVTYRKLTGVHCFRNYSTNWLQDTLLETKQIWITAMTTQTDANTGWSFKLTTAAEKSSHNLKSVHKGDKNVCDDVDGRLRTV